VGAELIQTDGTDRHEEIGVLREYTDGHENVCDLIDKGVHLSARATLTKPATTNSKENACM
jgi:hypothetical protein